MTDTSADGLDALNAILNENKPKKSGLMATILPVAILTVIGCAGGAAIGMLLASPAPTEPVAAAAPATPGAAASAEAGAEAHGKAAAPEAHLDMYGGNVEEVGPAVLLPLPPVITNLYAPADVWLRLQAAVVIRQKQVEEPELLATQIQADTLAFLRTVQLAQIEGGRGLLHLKEDLEERAKLRSPAVLDYVIQTMVTE
ncbi:flagellar basal body-associated FliL family protein [Mangrovibrevibacter kandeliae]|uniref:flagellar basal body-associated FliL family protein n=1 Tax=Mangrovibrevibacter kandeliae TaxID=2968473 RepID=UPI002117E87D|nr:flagellar basal body-associated FliL family protein [Aurantimonas sp. CSK15Z-1]MCQ8780922.1 flagellar basal body-associated FliL family protein [Aurantimonas sp. CSK15Z-1]